MGGIALGGGLNGGLTTRCKKRACYEILRRASKLWALVNTVINLRVSLKEQTSWANLSFSSKILSAVPLLILLTQKHIMNNT
jgi:hypothetical protein